MDSFAETTRAEILSRLASGNAQRKSTPQPAPLAMDATYKDFDMDEVADLTAKQMQKWMEKASDKTKAGLRVFAEKGPVILARDLSDKGVDNIAHFQSRTTIRTRTITGDPGAFLLGWDDWSAAKEGEGRYAVTPITHQSLRRFFHLD
jgi:hypothetical protein